MNEYLQLAWNHRAEIGGWILTALVSLTAAAHVMVKAAKAFQALAKRTATKRDDGLADSAVAATSKVAGVLDSIASVLPVIAPKGRSLPPPAPAHADLAYAKAGLGNPDDEDEEGTP